MLLALNGIVNNIASVLVATCIKYYSLFDIHYSL